MRPLFLLCIAVLTCAACETPTAFERDNAKDPESARFKPDAPAGLSAEAVRGAAVLTWEDHSAFEDGYFIEKSLGDSLSFAEVARAPANATTFADSTGPFDPRTFYRVSAFKEAEGAERRTTSRAVPLQLGRIASLEVEGTDGENARLTWTSAGLGTTMLIEMRKEGAPFREVAEVAHEEGAYVMDFTSLGFEAVRFRVSFFREQDDGQRLVIDTEEVAFDGAAAFGPSDVEVEVVSEEQMVVRWKDNSAFETGFEIVRQAKGPLQPLTTVGADRVTYEDAPLPYTESYPSFRRQHYAYEVRAVRTGGKSAPAQGEATFFMPSPVLRHRSNEDAQSVTLAWTHGTDLATAYVVERKVNDGAFAELARLSKRDTTYTDATVQTQNQYTYRVRSRISVPSEALVLTHQQRYTLRHTRKGHSNWVRSVAISPDGRFAASATNFHTSPYDLTTRLWDAQTGELLRSFTTAHIPASIAFSPDGEKLSIGAYSGAQIWDVKTGQQLFSSDDPTRSVAFSPDGASFATAGWQQGLRIWDGASGTQVRAFPFGRYLDLTFHPDENHIAGANLNSTDVLRIADGSTLLRIDHPRYLRKRSYWVDYSPDGATLAVAMSGHVIKAFDARNGELRFELSGKRLAFSTDGRWLGAMAGNASGKVLFYDAQTHRVVGQTDGTAAYGDGTFALSRDKRTLVTGGYYGEVLFWEQAGKRWQTRWQE